jgi:hypothetical protein
MGHVVAALSCCSASLSDPIRCAMPARSGSHCPSAGGARRGGGGSRAAAGRAGPGAPRGEGGRRARGSGAGLPAGAHSPARFPSLARLFMYTFTTRSATDTSSSRHRAHPQWARHRGPRFHSGAAGCCALFSQVMCTLAARTAPVRRAAATERARRGSWHGLLAPRRMLQAADKGMSRHRHG